MLNIFRPDCQVVKGIPSDRLPDKWWLTAFGWVVGSLFLCIPASAQTATFNYTGSQQTYTVPANVCFVEVDVRGGGGDLGALGSTWGHGGRVEAIIPVTPGEDLYIYVGEQANAENGGWNGGGDGAAGGGGGGGASDIRQGGTGFPDRVVVAGGGGGSGYGNGYRGGHGGGLTGASATGNYDGQGGTQNGGGAGGGGAVAGEDGGLGTGGNGAPGYPTGGGGSGYYGGGGGGAPACCVAGGGGWRQ